MSAWKRLIAAMRWYTHMCGYFFLSLNRKSYNYIQFIYGNWPIMQQWIMHELKCKFIFCQFPVLFSCHSAVKSFNLLYDFKKILKQFLAVIIYKNDQLGRQGHMCKLYNIYVTKVLHLALLPQISGTSNINWIFLLSFMRLKTISSNNVNLINWRISKMRKRPDQTKKLWLSCLWLTTAQCWY